MSRMIRFTLHRLSIISILFFVTVGCDQITKVVARDTLSVPLSYLGDSVRIQLAQNPGVFLSMGAGLHQAVRFWIFTVAVSFVLLLTVIYLLMGKKLTAVSTMGLSLIVGGGTGNLIDRIFFGSVTDFLNFGVGNFRTGILNIADMAIVSGVLLVMWAQRSARPGYNVNGAACTLESRD